MDYLAGSRRTNHLTKAIRGCWHSLIPGRSPELVQYFFLCDSDLLQEFDAVARLFCQETCQEVQGFYLVVAKPGLKAYRRTKCALEFRR
jgi:hypothetical protein